MIYLNAPSLKVGYCVGKKHGKAVQRNHIKRLIRAAFMQVKDKIGNYYVAFIPKVYKSYSYNVFLQDIVYLITKENLYENNEDNK